MLAGEVGRPPASAEEMESLSAEDRAWLREALSTPETEESLTVAILLARGTAPDPAARGAIALLAESGKTERIREAARDSLRARAL